MQVPFLDLKTQYKSIQDEIAEAIEQVLQNTAFVGGSPVQQFEQDFSEYTGSKHVVGVGNGTDALVLALKALDLPAGFEAIVPANSFIATSEAVTMAGGQVVFCDCEADNYLLDLKDAEKKVTARTRVILPVHLYGQMVDQTAVRHFAEDHSLLIIEDAAQAHGAHDANNRVGEIGHLTSYSFYPGKNLGAYGDAGAVTTNDPNLAIRVRKLANHGGIEKYRHDIEGGNSRLDGIQAVVLSVKLRYINQWNAQRQAAAVYYNRGIEKLGLPTPGTTHPNRHVYHLYVTRVPDRDRVLGELHSKGVGAGIHYPVALPFLPAYSRLGHRLEDFPVAHSQMSQIISLPIFPEISHDQIDHVVSALGQALAK